MFSKIDRIFSGKSGLEINNRPDYSRKYGINGTQSGRHSIPTLQVQMLVIVPEIFKFGCQKAM